MTEGNSLNLEEAAGNFLARLSPAVREASQPEVYRFVRWFGKERTLGGLLAPEIANYAEGMSPSDTDYDRKMETIRSFLAYAKKAGWSKSNLATHLKARKGKGSALTKVQGTRQSISLTRDGYDRMQAELAELKQRRIEITEEVRRAAADKDFRENAPLHAAREQKGHIEGRIKELEETLKLAVVIEEKATTLKVTIGDGVVLYDERTDRELECIIVHPTEVDSAKGRISCESPIGRAIMGRGEGEVVEVTAPAGKLRYVIKRISH
jgi:transcription elongation factor GreA